MRGIIPLDGFHVPARLARTVRTTPFTVSVNRDFDAVIDGCAEARTRPRPHLDQRAHPQDLSQPVRRTAIATRVEVYDGDALVGGLYGVSLGRAFFGESMFHRARDASKIALVHLVARLRAGGYRLLDTQYVTDHLKSFGAVEVGKRRYHRLLEEAIIGEADFGALPLDRPVSGEEALATNAISAAPAGSRGCCLRARRRRALRLRRLRRLLGAPAAALDAGASATFGFCPPLQSVSHTS